MQGYGKVPTSAHSAYICVYVFAASTERCNPLQAIRSLLGHPTGGPSLRDGHSQLSHRIKRIGSAREKRMENDFLVNCSTPFLVASRSDATPCKRSVHYRATLQGVRRAGPCGCFAVRATRSPNPTPLARAHHATDKQSPLHW